MTGCDCEKKLLGRAVVLPLSEQHLLAIWVCSSILGDIYALIISWCVLFLGVLNGWA